MDFEDELFLDSNNSEPSSLSKIIADANVDGVNAHEDEHTTTTSSIDLNSNNNINKPTISTVTQDSINNANNAVSTSNDTNSLIAMLDNHNIDEHPRHPQRLVTPLPLELINGGNKAPTPKKIIVKKVLKTGPTQKQEVKQEVKPYYVNRTKPYNSEAVHVCCCVSKTFIRVPTMYFFFCNTELHAN